MQRSLRPATISKLVTAPMRCCDFIIYGIHKRISCLVSLTFSEIKLTDQSIIFLNDWKVM